MPAVQIGLKNLVYAIMTADTLGGASYSAPKALVGAISATVNPNSSTETLFADDGPMETATALGKIDLDLTVGDLPFEAQADLLGHSMVNGVLVRKSGDIPPFVAVGFKSVKSNGKYRYVWLLKGKFSLPEIKGETKGDKIAFNSPVIKGTFVKRDFDDAWIKQTDEDSASYVNGTGAAWFTNVEGDIDVSIPTVNVVPVDAAATVLASANIVWTFSKPINSAFANNQNFFVYKDADKTNVPCTVSINGAGTIVTLHPSSNLTAAAKYVSVCTGNVTDVYGNTIAAGKIAAFTVAA